MTGSAGRTERLVQAARTFIGTPFRLHGRQPESGLDCIGLVHVSLLAVGCQSAPPQGYRLRNLDIARWLGCAEASGLSRTSGPPMAGDILLITPGPTQQHLVICDDAHHAIHAHAGLRRVVRQEMRFPSEPLAHWRLL